LHYWPQIRQRVPDAELHAFYGWDVFDKMAMRDPHRMAFKLRLLAKAAEVGGEESGVFLHGRVSQPELARQMRDARVWGYPTYFTETSCIGAMEARAAGLPIVTTALGALNETAFGQILIRQGVDGDSANPLDEVYGERFVHHVCTLLTDRHAWQKASTHAARGITDCTWESRTADWLELLAPVALEAAA
jgi:glycosyltransferase involved in cell wall biosynthesis